MSRKKKRVKLIKMQIILLLTDNHVTDDMLSAINFRLNLAFSKRIKTARLR